MTMWMDNEWRGFGAHIWTSQIRKASIVNWLKCWRGRKKGDDLWTRQAEETVRVIGFAAQKDGRRCDLQSVLGSLDAVHHRLSALPAHAGRRVLIHQQFVLIADEEQVANLIVDRIASLSISNVNCANDTEALPFDFAHGCHIGSPGFVRARISFGSWESERTSTERIRRVLRVLQVLREPLHPNNRRDSRTILSKIFWKIKACWASNQFQVEIIIFTKREPIALFTLRLAG